MNTWVALLRGVNVGGAHRLPMAELRNGLAGLGLENVRTYIQSGNVVFESSHASDSALAVLIADHIEQRHGFRAEVLVLGAENLREAVKSNPFPEALSDPRSLHFFFLASPARQADMDALAAAVSPTERFCLTERVLYLHAPDGVGRSRLAASAEKRLGVVTTARNARTVMKLMALTSVA